MAALWGENHERNIKDATRTNTIHGCVLALGLFVLVVVICLVVLESYNVKVL